MKILSSFIVVVLLAITSIYAEEVPQNKAIIVATAFYSTTSEDSFADNVVVSSVVPVFNSQGELMMYAVNFSDTGFVLVSAEDLIRPVLAYSHESFFTGENIPVQLQGLLEEYKNLISYIRVKEPVRQAEVASEWSSLINNSSQRTSRSTSGPIIPCQWDQGSFYNGLCPEDPMGPGGRVYAGCVATAMSMVMYWHRYPDTGAGQHGYMSDYGWLEVDYTLSLYDWNAMPTKLTGPNYPVAKLQYDAGVAVDMMYSPNGSGAYMDDAARAMRTHFKYNPDLTIEVRDDYSLQDWITLLKSQLDLGYPLIYAGYGSGGPGHAFVCDGYDSGDMFHFNWGWSGAYNGFYVMDYLTPGGYDFSSWQMAFINCYPSDSNYPYGCQGADTLTAMSGTIADGSGFENYGHNSNCSWLIQPEFPVEFITLKFHILKTESINDQVCVYDGNDATAPLLGCFSGDILPAEIISSGQEMYITFQTNSSVNNHGFFAEYSSKIVKFCDHFTTLTEAEGTIEDGSGPYSYQPSSFCRWWIKPEDAGAIIIDFVEMDLEEDEDFLVLMNPATYPSSEIIRFTGNQLPQTYTHWGSSLIVMFTSNDYNQHEGWKINYSSLPASIEESELSDVIIHPNPVSEYLNIGNLPSSCTIRLTDFSGRILFSGSFSGPDASIKTTHLSGGIYFLQISTENTSLVRKIIR